MYGVIYLVFISAIAVRKQPDCSRHYTTVLYVGTVQYVLHKGTAVVYNCDTTAAVT